MINWEWQWKTVAEWIWAINSDPEIFLREEKLNNVNKFLNWSKAM